MGWYHFLAYIRYPFNTELPELALNKPVSTNIYNADRTAGEV